jgi:RNA polymerase sigma-70 factor (ECF subfamily)
MEGFERLFNEHFHSVYHYVYYMVGNKSDAEDVTQEIFLKIANADERYTEVTTLRAWIFTIARRAVIDFLRKKRTKKFLAFWKNYIPEDLDIPDERKNMPENILIQKEEKDSIFSYVDRLPEKMKTIIYLRIIQGVPVQEVATLLDISPNNVSVLQNRAIAKLRSMIDSASFALEEIK